MNCPSRLKYHQLMLIVTLLWTILASRYVLSNNPSALDNIDSAGFDRLAQNMLTGRGFTMDNYLFCPESVRTPGYPLFLASIYSLFGDNLHVVFLIQGLLDLLVAATIFRLTYALVRPYPLTAGLITLIFYLLTLSQWRFDNELLSEGWLTPLLALSVFTFWQSGRTRRVRSALLSGFLLGMVILTKPNYEIVPLAFLLGYMIIPRLTIGQRFSLGIALALGLAIILATWYLRNESLFGEFFLSRTYDENISRVAAVVTLAEVNHESVQAWSPRWEALYGDLVSAAGAYYQWDNSQALTCQSLEQRRQQVASIAMQTISEHPQAFFIAYAKSMIRALLPQEQFYWYEKLTGQVIPATSTTDSSWLVRLLNRPILLLLMWAIWLIGYALSYLGMIIGIYALRHQPHLLLVMITLIVIGLFLPGPLAYVRFRVPVAPYMVILQTIGLAYTVQKLCCWTHFSFFRGRTII